LHRSGLRPPITARLTSNGPPRTKVVRGEAFGAVVESHKGRPASDAQTRGLSGVGDETETTCRLVVARPGARCPGRGRGDPPRPEDRDVLGTPPVDAADRSQPRRHERIGMRGDDDVVADDGGKVGDDEVRTTEQQGNIGVVKPDRRPAQ